MRRWAAAVFVSLVVMLSLGVTVLSGGAVSAVDASPELVATPDEGDGAIDERASFPTERPDADSSSRDSLTIWSAIFVVGTATLAIGGWWTNRRSDRDDAPLSTTGS